jgi:hypothetical protein
MVLRSGIPDPGVKKATDPGYRSATLCSELALNREKLNLKGMGHAVEFKYLDKSRYFKDKMVHNFSRD